MSGAFNPPLRMLIQSTTCFRYKTENLSLSIMPFLVSGLVPSALELAVLTVLRPHFRIQDGASLVSAKGLEALATLSPRDEAGQRHVQTMLRRKVMAQHVDRRGWLHFFAGKTPRRSNQLLAAMLNFFSEGIFLGRFCKVEMCESVLLHRLRFDETMFWVVFKRMSHTQKIPLCQTEDQCQPCQNNNASKPKKNGADAFGLEALRPFMIVFLPFLAPLVNVFPCRCTSPLEAASGDSREQGAVKSQQ